MSEIPFRPSEDVTRVLPGLRVTGYDVGSADAAALANFFAGPLKQFYLQQSQNHAAGTTDQSAKFVDRGEFQMRYLNQFGVETVTLTVHAEAAGKILKKLPWDWAVIDFDLPWVPYAYENPGSGTQLVGGWQGVYARCVGPPIDPQTYHGGYEYASAGVPGTFDEYKWSREGLNVDTGDETNWKPFVAWAVADFPADIPDFPAGDVDRRSLRIDLRDYPTTEALIFDIYGAYPDQRDFGPTVEPRVGAVFTVAYDNPAPNVIKTLEVFTGWTEAQVLTMYPELTGIYDHLITNGPFPGSGWDVTEAFALAAKASAYQYSTGGSGNAYIGGAWYGGFDPTQWQSSFPPVADEIVESVGTLGYRMYKHTGSWFFRSDYPLSTGSVPYLGYWRPTGGDAVYNIFDYWAYYCFMPHEFDGAFPIQFVGTAAVNATLFRGTPPWVEDRYRRPFDNDATVSEWDISGQSERFGLGNISQTGTVARYDLAGLPDHVAEQHHFGLTFLGKLIVSPTEGYVSFTPA